MNKETEQLIIEIKKEIALIDKAIEQADKTDNMTRTESAIVLGACYEGVYPKPTLWKAYRSLCAIKQDLEFTCKLIIEHSQMHESSLMQKMIQQPTITCVTHDTATTPIANADSDTPCFESNAERVKWEIINPDETLIITSPNHFNTIILANKNRRLIVRNFCNENTTEATLTKHLEGLPTTHRHIQFTGKINIGADKGINRPMLFSIEETLNGLMIRPIKRTEVHLNQDLQN